MIGKVRRFGPFALAAMLASSLVAGAEDRLVLIENFMHDG